MTEKMTVEIELKFIALPSAVHALPASLARWPLQHTPAQTLSNIYYETASQTLRRHDMGLRIRGCDGAYEMTLKTAGSDVGGLHQRPEYNVALDAPQLDLRRFPAQAWPEGCDVDALQTALQPLFSTDFQRERWEVTYRESQIEVALDRGDIRAAGESEGLHEIELELLRGERDDLFAFAEQLLTLEGIRMGAMSKAARGYRLAAGNAALRRRAFPLLRPAARASVEQGMSAALAQILAHWQYHEEAWLRGDAASRGGIQEALTALRQSLTLFGGIVPRKASATLRAGLSALEEQIQQPTCVAQTLCYGRESLTTQWALTRWLAESGWRAYLDAAGSAKLSGSFKRFADIMLGRCGAELKALFAQVRHPQEYQDKLPRLQHQILAIRLLGGAYGEAAVEDYLAPWQTLAQAIVHPAAVTAEAACAQALHQPAFWRNGAH
ncbi:inorganic triphosphatase [Edwardsiella piscicida]|nr:inorganic triphosphatase [Edwardsiella piscicida]